MVKLLDRVKQAVSGTASSTTLGAAAEGFRTMNTAGAATNDVIRYAIEDDSGAFEIGTIKITGATTGTRTVELSSNSNNALTLSGNAVIFATLSASDFSGNAAPIWTTTPPSSLNLDNDGSTAVTLAGVAIDDFPVVYSWDGHAGTNLYNASNLPPQLASAPTFSGGTASLVGSSTASNAGSFNFRLKATDGVKTATAITAISLVFEPDLANATYDSKSFSVASQDTSPTGLTFSSAGDKMYVVGRASDKVHQYDLSTNWDVSTATYNSVNFSVASQDTNPYGVAFSSTGDKMYVLGGYGKTVDEYNLSTNWDLSSASYNSVSFSVASQDSQVEDLEFSSAGDKMYVVGRNTDKIYEYDLTADWDLSTASYNSVSFSVSSQETTPKGLTFSSTGKKMYVAGSATDKVFEYDLTTAWSVSSASYNSVSFSVASQDTSPEAITFSSVNDKMYVLGSNNDTIYQYST